MKFHYKNGEEDVVVVDALSHVPCWPEGILMKPTNTADAQWSILDEPALCLSKYPLRYAGLVADQSNGHLRPTGMVADCTMTQEQ